MPYFIWSKAMNRCARNKQSRPCGRCGVRLMIWLALLVVLGLTGACKGGPDAEPEAEVQHGPISPAATNLLTRAQMALSDGQDAMALHGVNEAIRRAPHFHRAHLIRGQILTRMDSLEEARAAFEMVRKIDPAYPAIHFHLGNNAVQRRQYDEALDYYEAEDSLTPDTLLENKHALWMQMGNVYRELGETDEARAAYEKILAVDEGFDLAYDAIGQLYQEEGDFDSALEARKRALELNPENGGYAYHVGALLYQLGRPAEAIPYLEQSRQKLPWFYGSYYNLGRSLIDLGKTAEGERYLITADSLQGRQAQLGMAKASAETHRTPRAWMAYADMLYGDERYEEALQAYQAARALDPLNEAARDAIAEIQGRLSRQD